MLLNIQYFTLQPPQQGFMRPNIFVGPLVDTLIYINPEKVHEEQAVPVEGHAVVARYL